MEMEMEEDEEMELEKDEEELVVFEAREIDIDYEFDAAMYFDFTRPETFEEARESEKWFDTAQSHPPSPFAVKLELMEGVGNSVETETECGDVLLGRQEASGTVVDDDDKDCERTYGGIFTSLQSVDLQNVPKPMGFAAEVAYQNKYTGKLNAKTGLKKKNVPRSSTLMKPTASMLAKQNRPAQLDCSRFQPLFSQKEKNICSSSAGESQATKRQKLEGGLSLKVGDAKQHTDFIHKASKKDGTVDNFSAQSRLRLTIPREPGLETANRAHRIRHKPTAEVEHAPVVVQRFKARPLNRKILEAPLLPLPKKSTPKLPEFQEFHLKTLERAMQHTSAVSSSSLRHKGSEQVDKPGTVSGAETEKKEFRRPSTMHTQKQDRCSAPHAFIARPLNKKIFTSRGDIGVFRNNKRETTVPSGFNFQTEKRVRHNPPIDLFSKLSLASELQPNNGHRLQQPQPSLMSSKGSKENRSNHLHTEHKMTHSLKEKPPPVFGVQQTRSSEVRNQLSMRTLGVR